MKRKRLGLIILGAFGIWLGMSGCTSNHRIPEPERNPLILTSEAQTVPFHVKYLERLSTATGTVEEQTNNIGNAIIETLTADGWLKVVYDLRQGKKDNQEIFITVTENNSVESRSATFNLCAFIKSTALTVTQEGKK